MMHPSNCEVDTCLSGDVLPFKYHDLKFSKLYLPNKGRMWDNRAHFTDK